MSPSYTKDELSYALRKTKAKILWTTYDLKSVAVAAVQELGNDCSILLLEPQPSSTETCNSLQTLANLGKSYGEHKQTGACKIPPGKTNKDVCAFLNLSSGTTGLPKAVGDCSVTKNHETTD